MANTYTQIYFHVIFAVYGRRSLIKPECQDRLYEYIAGALKKHGHMPYVINGMRDHVHMLFGMSPKESLSELVQSLKIQTSLFLKEEFHYGIFEWQKGYSAFSYSKSLLPAVSQYIQNQKEHHKKRTFSEEMRDILEKSGIKYDDRYILRGFDEPACDTEE